MISDRSPDPVEVLKRQLGDELRRLRETVGLTQAALARRTGYQRVSVTQVESGRQDCSRGFVQCMEAALDAHGHLLPIYDSLATQRRRRRTARQETTLNDYRAGQPAQDDDVNRRQLLRHTAALTASAALPLSPLAPRTSSEHHTVPAVIPTSAEHEIVAALRRALLAPPPSPATAERLDLAALMTRVHLAWKLRQGARYLDLGRLLPPLLADLDAAIRHVDADALQIEANRLLVHSYNAASSVLKKLGDPALAAIAADRAILTARALDDPLLVAAGAYRQANVFLPAGCLDEAKDLALSGADLLEPTLDSSPVRLATWGALRLTAAVAAAGRHDTAIAWELLGEAKTAARQLGTDHADLHTIFGPTSVAIYSVQVAAELGNGHEVLRRAQTVNIDRLPAGLFERRTHFLINVARGHTQQHNDCEAVATLLHAERLAPEEIRLDTTCRTLVADLLRRERRSATPQLRELALRIGIAA